jgi:hypothetical protein
MDNLEKARLAPTSPTKRSENQQMKSNNSVNPRLCAPIFPVNFNINDDQHEDPISYNDVLMMAAAPHCVPHCDVKVLHKYMHSNKNNEVASALVIQHDGAILFEQIEATYNQLNVSCLVYKTTANEEDDFTGDGVWIGIVPYCKPISYKQNEQAGMDFQACFIDEIKSIKFSEITFSAPNKKNNNEQKQLIHLTNKPLLNAGDGNPFANNKSATQQATAIKEEFSLESFSLNGNSTDMEKQMLDDKFVMNGIAILGQATAIYAKPNAGKTLTTLKLIIDAINTNDIDAKDIFYINADDNYKGLVTKLKLAEKHNFHMLCPGHKGFKPNEFQEYLANLILSDNARGVVIILDTLKKFNDIMDKKASSDFGVVMRAFVSKGGTIIMLAHTNKNRDNDNKVVFSGTSDIVDDVDCAFTIDVTEETDTHKTILFENIKSRGDVSREVAYKYLLKADSYEALVDSVTAVDEQEALKQKESKRVDDLLYKNELAIDAIIDAINDGTEFKTEIIDAAMLLSGLSRPKITTALNAHTGLDYSKGHRWQEIKGVKNSKKYILTPTHRIPIRSYSDAKGL